MLWWWEMEKKDLIVLHGFLGMGDNWKTHAKKLG